MKQPAEILDRMPDAGPAQGQQTKVPKANRGSAAQAMIASTMQRTCSGSAQKMPDQQFAEMQSQAMIARPKVQRRANGVCAANANAQDRNSGDSAATDEAQAAAKASKAHAVCPNA